MIRRRTSSRTRLRGFSLVELIATTAILATIMSSVTFIIFAALDGYTTVSIESRLYRTGSAALERITRELRQIPLDADASAPAPDIDFISPTTIRFDDGREIALSGTNLRINQGGGPRLLAEQVAALRFEAFDANRSPVALPASGDACDPIRRIRIEIELADHGTTATLRSMVFIRSMMGEGL